MQISWDEVRGWAGLILSYLVALLGVGRLFWSAFLKKINAVAEALRKEREKELDEIKKTAAKTSDNCIAHGTTLGEHERRLIMAEGDGRVAVASLAEINVHLERIERGVEDLRKDMNKEDVSVAGRLGAVEAGVNMLLSSAGLKK